jgi:hypothetical protein
VAARTARARAGDDGGDDRSSARINGRSERREDRRAGMNGYSDASPFKTQIELVTPVTGNRSYRMSVFCKSVQQRGYKLVVNNFTFVYVVNNPSFLMPRTTLIISSCPDGL